MSQQALQDKLQDSVARLEQLEKAYTLGYGYALVITKRNIDSVKKEISRIKQLIKKD